MKLVPLSKVVENMPCAYGDEIGANKVTLPVAKVSNIDAAGNFHNNFEHRSFTKIQATKLVCQRGDLLVVKSSGSKTNVLSGKTAICGEEHAGRLVSSNFLLRLRPKKDLCDSKYLWHFLNSQSSKDFVLKVVGTTTYPNLKWSTYSEHPIPLPLLAEQKRIAAILDKADAIRRKRQAAIKLADDFLRATFLDMFGDPVTNPKGWDVKPFNTVCSNYDSKRIPLKMSDRSKRTGPYPYYGASGIIDSIDEYIFDGEYLLVGEDGANLVARSTPIAFLATGQFWVNNHAHVLGSNGKATLQFLEKFFSFIDLKPFISGSAQPKLTRSKLDNIPVPLPPMDLQRWLHLLRQHSVDFKWSLCFWLRCRLYRWQHGDVGLFRCLPV